MIDRTRGSFAAVSSKSIATTSPGGNWSRNSRALTKAIGQLVPIKSSSGCGVWLMVIGFYVFGVVGGFVRKLLIVCKTWVLSHESDKAMGAL